MSKITDSDKPKSPFTVVKGGRKKKTPSPLKGRMPTGGQLRWQKPLDFPEDAAALLKKNKISKKQFSKYAEQVLLFLITKGSADYSRSLLKQVRKGEKEGMKTFGQILGFIKNDSAVTVNLHQNNLSLNQGVQESRDFSSIVRMLDDRDRKAIAPPEPIPVDDDIIDAEVEEVE